MHLGMSSLSSSVMVLHTVRPSATVTVECCPTYSLVHCKHNHHSVAWGMLGCG